MKGLNLGHFQLRIGLELWVQAMLGNSLSLLLLVFWKELEKHKDKEGLEGLLAIANS